MTGARRGGDGLSGEGMAQLRPDDEERRLDSQLREELAKPGCRDLGHRAQRPLVEGRRVAPVDRRVAGEPVEIDRDARDHGLRRVSSCR